MLFGSRKPKITRQQQLAAKPLRLVDPEVNPDASGGAKLKVKVQPRSWARWFMAADSQLTKTFELDSIGLKVWNICDGRTSVQQIIRMVAREHRLSLREAEVSTLAFLNILTRRGLVGIPTEEQKKKD